MNQITSSIKWDNELIRSCSKCEQNTSLANISHFVLMLKKPYSESLFIQPLGNLILFLH